MPSVALAATRSRVPHPGVAVRPARSPRAADAGRSTELRQPGALDEAVLRRFVAQSRHYLGLGPRR